MKYRRKPIALEASQWFKMGDHPAVVPLVPSRRDPKNPSYKLETPGENISLNNQDYFPGMEKTHGFIRTLEGGYIVTPGDWIITGVDGEHWAVKPDKFEKTYEADGTSSLPSYEIVDVNGEPSKIPASPQFIRLGSNFGACWFTVGCGSKEVIEGYDPYPINMTLKLRTP